MLAQDVAARGADPRAYLRRVHAIELVGVTGVRVVHAEGTDPPAEWTEDSPMLRRLAGVTAVRAAVANPPDSRSAATEQCLKPVDRSVRALRRSERWGRRTFPIVPMQVLKQGQRANAGREGTSVLTVVVVMADDRARVGVLQRGLAGCRGRPLDRQIVLRRALTAGPAAAESGKESLGTGTANPSRPRCPTAGRESCA